MWGFAAATMHESCPVAPPASQSVLYFEKSNFSARALKFPAETPAIAFMNCSRRSGAAYSFANNGSPESLISFCGCPV